MTDKDKIRTEVERCISDYNHWKNRVTDRCSWVDAVNMLEDTLEHISKFIDSLQEEPVSEDLEEAAIEYCGGNKGSDARVRAGFIMGANWQKQQMMKDAIEREVQTDAGGYPYIDINVELYDYDNDVPLAKKGDKYKIILIKE